MWGWGHSHAALKTYADAESPHMDRELTGETTAIILFYLDKKKKAFEKLQDLSLQETNTSYDIHLSDIKWVALAACLAAQKTLKSQTLKNSGKKRVKK